MWVVDLLIALVAVYGAVLSTINYLGEREGLRVDVSLGFLAGPDYFSETQLFLKAANTGNKPVTISSMGYEVIGHNFSLFEACPESNITFPYELQPGKSCDTWGPPERLIEPLSQKKITGAVKLQPYFYTQTGKSYKGAPFEVDTAEWSAGDFQISRKNKVLTRIKAAFARKRSS